MSDFQNAKHKKGSAKAEGVMIGVIENLFVSDEKNFVADDVFRDTQGTRILGVMLEGGVRHSVSFTLGNGQLPPGEYEFPGDEVDHIYYMMVQPGFPELIYRAERARLTIRENDSRPYISGDLIFDTETVDSFHYQVRINNFEITG
ncbi:hypothetical protein CCU68_10080 [Pseudomonas gingeri NCPPB 3146 = LMG 5327]|uniref:Uncharacterized protein n=2 Tax=Pseudomonas gingeri TaxID=117681 RepID=A0A7Y8CCR6_9PSED|nr:MULTISPECIES: hypothetical protein [Pseudomonas]NVZ24774.1 hypothetical protein [Pseudomonas gingeri]NWC13196.1 hypothetical protein [Pseudomonas gingeri]PNQ92644.1 hypothetical protein CCU68_10080 [Pseudomonas gingeri NCPPB 3146 = LMG 5327]BBP77437.1 hypothetical protein PHLH7_35410 [Pseudomonas sp. Ost2]